MRNVAASLKPNGILCIWEGAAPARDTPSYSKNLELMKKYHTLERPYSRQQLVQMLDLAGFGHLEFYAQLNGFFNLDDTADKRKLQVQTQSAEHWNIVIAARTADFFKTNGRTPNLHLRDSKNVSSLPVMAGVDFEWGGKALLRENMRYVRRRMQRMVSAWRRSRQVRMEQAVTTIYVELLGRKPDAAGLAYYVAELAGGRSPADLRQSLMASDEYLNRNTSD